jgi:hypothetical protein
MKRTKRITLILKAIAKDLPKKNYEFETTLKVKGEEIVKKGVATDADNKSIDESKIYTTKAKVSRLVNHQNRLKSAFDANGFQGVKAYMAPFIKEELRSEFFAKLKSAIG